MHHKKLTSAGDSLNHQARDIINEISAALTSEELLSLNSQSVTDQSPAATSATQWLEEKGLV